MPPRRICANPLFLSWVEELRIDAQAKGMKSAEAYGKACKSLAACPVTYERPRELICLTGVGAKTVDILEKKWRAWCIENGKPIDPSPEKRKKTRQPSTSPLPEGISDLDTDPDLPGPSSATSKPTSKAKAKAKAPAKPKTYVPQSRSGAYAILLALVLAIESPLACTQVYMTKSELSRAAQPFSESSFSSSEKGSFYTAWNSMKTLVGKGMVYATGNPQRYCLTEEGYDTACAIRALLPEYAHIPKYPFLHDSIPTSIAQTAALSRAHSAALPTAGPSRSRPTLPSPPQSYDLSASPSPPLFPTALPRASSTSSSKAPRPSSSSISAPVTVNRNRNKFQFWYISSTATRVHQCSDAMIRLDPDEFVNLRKIEYRFHQRDHPFVKQQVRLADASADARVRDESGQATLFGYLMEEGAPPRCSMFEEDESVDKGKEAAAAGQSDGRKSVKTKDKEVPKNKVVPKKRPSLLDADGPLYGTSTDFGTWSRGQDVYGGIGMMIGWEDEQDFLPLPTDISAPTTGPPAKRARAPMSGRKEIGGSSFTFSRTTSAPTGTAITAVTAGSKAKMVVHGPEVDVGDDEEDELLQMYPSATALRTLKKDTATASLSTIEAGPSRARPASTSATNYTAPVLPRGPRLSSHMSIPNPLTAHYSSTSIPTPHPETPTDQAESSTFTTPHFHPSQAIIFPPSSYTIVLIIDTREIESKSSRDRITESLLSKGVNVETRSLKLGDMCWVARHDDGLGGEEDECILDYVVERKRLDDLCSSIRDGRYTEQCHRLGNSGIRNVYYIVEDFQVAERMEYNGLQIQTAKSQIQVHNRFFLKETHKLSETIDFLCTMTKVIQTSLAGKELRVIPTKYLSRPTYSALQARLRGGTNGDYLTSFEAYQALNDKSASITLKDKFARMLMCVKGMSAEKVAAVLDVWETPRAMWEDLRGEEKRFKLEARAREAAGALHGDGQGEGNKEDKGKGKKKEVVRGKEMFFADRVKGEGRRKIGDALSRELYRMLMGDEE